MRRPIAEEFVRDHTSRHAALRFQQFAEETRGCPSIPPRLYENVDHVTVLVDGPPEILTAALNIHEQLVQIPRVAQATWSVPQPPSVVGLERPTPVPNGLVGDGDAALGEQVLGITEAETKAVVEPDGVTE